MCDARACLDGAPASPPSTQSKVAMFAAAAYEGPTESSVTGLPVTRRGHRAEHERPERAEDNALPRGTHPNRPPIGEVAVLP